MKVCIIGEGLTSLSLAKNLINKKINVHIYQNKQNKNLSSNRTIGISKNNLEFFKKKIYQIPKKNIWGIQKIEIYSDKLIKNKILNFEYNKNNLFFMIKNEELYNHLNNKLSKNKLFKRIIIKKFFFYNELFKKNNYDLIINCNQNNFLSKKYFTKKIVKNYKNLAYTTILEHEKLENNTAVQIFTKYGPIAFLPLSKNKTSVVFSIDVKNKRYNNNEVIDLINKYNPKFKINKKIQLTSFKLESSNLRNYYHKNVLAFGDLLHRVHPLAGQGFNMTIRDIKILSEIIQNKIDLGIQLDCSLLKEFEIQAKNSNFIFSNGVDYIYEFFNFDKKTKDKNLIKFLKFIGKNKALNNLIIKLANRGFTT